MTHYFKKFPKINYNNNLAINLLARVTMSKLALNSKQAYYDYVVKEGTRPDNLSYDYYSNSDYIWLINLANQFVDPYYDFPISEDNLKVLITKKYGSVAKAQNTIKFFRTNWSADESRITPTAYSAFGVGQRKYWAPEINQNNSIIAYVRKKEDWIVTTNKVQQLSIDNASFNLLTEGNFNLTTETKSGNVYDIIVDSTPATVTDASFIAGELVSQNGVTFATVVTASETTLVIHHVSGTAVTGEITGLTSGASGTVASLVTVSTNIPSNELVYWESVSIYDYDIEQNNKKKNIKLIDNRFADAATKELKNLLLI